MGRNPHQRGIYIGRSDHKRTPNCKPRTKLDCANNVYVQCQPGPTGPLGGPPGPTGVTPTMTEIAYTPTNSGDWGSSIPTTLQEALDTLAANTTIP